LYRQLIKNVGNAGHLIFQPDLVPPASDSTLSSRGNNRCFNVVKWIWNRVGVEQACNIFYILHWILYFLP